MKSYTLAIAISMLLSAVYAFQNASSVTVRFLFLERSLPQGIWEVLLFSAGVVLMWVFSLVAMLEMRGKLKGRIKDLEDKVRGLEEEKRSLLEALGRSGGANRPSAQALDEAPYGQRDGEEGKTEIE
ncbi:MAG: LapA family protein [Thermanaerothrix sp.]|nr:LapA family protein [Thermanaerothrix sp.]